jgi:hypothetical protein
MVVYDRNLSLETAAYFVGCILLATVWFQSMTLLYARYAMDGIDLSLLTPEPQSR